jgi:anti-sigma B factor antagonist
MTTKPFTFDLVESAVPGERIYRLQGPLVLNNMFAFQELLRSESTTTILDFSEVPYIDSAGLGVLTNSYVAHQRRGQKLLLVAVCERVTELFKITNLDKLFEVFPDIESARRAV